MGKLRFGTAIALGSVLSVVAAFAVGDAQAADLSARPMYKAPAAPPPPPPFNWTGFYIGANIGAAWAHGDFFTSTGHTFDNNSEARFIGGGQIGYNWQFDRWVIGIEGTADGIAGNGRHSRDVFIDGRRFNAFADATFLATAAGRLGWAADNWLFYGKGGGAWVGFDRRVDCVDGLCAGTFVSDSRTRFGWLAGGGIEWAFDRNWTAKVEYNFIGLEDHDIGTAWGFDTRFRNPNVQTVTVGVNYLFH
jgi:outer membrane immunogenic protein